MSDHAAVARADMRPVEGNAFDLAVSYHAFMAVVVIPHDDLTPQQWAEISTWGRILDRTQRFFGIEVCPQGFLMSQVTEAAKRNNLPVPPTNEASF